MLKSPAYIIQRECFFSNFFILADTSELGLPETGLGIIPGAGDVLIDASCY